MSNKKLITFNLLVLSLLAALLAAGCQPADQPDPGRAVEDYYKALVAKDANALSTLSCADWADDALTELDSFAAVTVTLEEAACTAEAADGDAATVTCTGKMVANYNGENLEIDLADRSYTVVVEGGEWLMCGYR